MFLLPAMTSLRHTKIYKTIWGTENTSQDTNANMRSWSERSRKRLESCHTELQLLANEVLQIHDCSVITGHRGKEDQNRMYAEGKSKLKWPNGKHNSYPSMAIDLAPYVDGVEPWDLKYSLYFAGIVLGVADILYKQDMMQHNVRWGGNWSVIRDGKAGARTFKNTPFYDGLHFELV